MYSIRLGYADAIQRITNLIANGHQSEALVTSAFTVEKTLRRTLRQIVVSAGFNSTIAEKIVERLYGLEAIKSAWELYEPRHRALPGLVGNADWATFKLTATMRNKLIHGERVYQLAEAQQQATETLAALNRVKALFDAEYGFSGWDRLRVRRVSRLHSDPTITWTKGQAAKGSPSRAVLGCPKK